MKKYILIPDSFKGTLSSAQICAALAGELRAAQPGAEIISIPVADGGEGTVDALLSAVGGERVRAACHGPFGEELEGFYGLLPDGAAVIEMAAAAGLPLVSGRLQPDRTTTYGVGELIAAALARGARRIVLGLGGSATNDGGCGAAAALGVRFLRVDGSPFVPTGGTLGEIAHISMDGVDPALREAQIAVMCDIDNPLCGPAGASAVFGPQKGADEPMVARLDDGLRHLAEVIRTDLGMDVLDLPGGGAAGGMGAGAVAFLGGRLQMGIETVLDLTHFDTRAADADLIFTGEGRLDSQSLRGKVVVGVARRAKRLGVPVIAFVGASERELAAVYEEGVAGVFPINPEPRPFEEVRGESEENLRFTARNLIHFLGCLQK
ncbi:MAG: glycerate kinase [Butyricicoccus sp.]